MIGIIDMISFISTFEFICSQAPTNMNGMLTGIYWFIRASYISIGGIMKLFFSKYLSLLDMLNCLVHFGHCFFS